MNRQRLLIVGLVAVAGAIVLALWLAPRLTATDVSAPETGEAR